MLSLRLLTCLIVLAGVLCSGVKAIPPSSNWTGPYAPCNRKMELTKRNDMVLGVRFSSANHAIEQQFRNALDFWSQIIEMTWHEDNNETCALQLVDGTPQILNTSIVARAQFTDWTNFQGWVAFNPNTVLTPSETFFTAVHEIGHVLGLKHSSNRRSVMYYLDLNGPEYLDAEDVAQLSTRHALRPNVHAGLRILPIEKGVRAPAFASAQTEAALRAGGGL